MELKLQKKRKNFTMKSLFTRHIFSMWSNFLNCYNISRQHTRLRVIVFRDSLANNRDRCPFVSLEGHCHRGSGPVLARARARYLSGGNSGHNFVSMRIVWQQVGKISTHRPTCQPRLSFPTPRPPPPPPSPPPPPLSILQSSPLRPPSGVPVPEYEWNNSVSLPFASLPSFPLLFETVIRVSRFVLSKTGGTKLSISIQVDRNDLEFVDFFLSRKKRNHFDNVQFDSSLFTLIYIFIDIFLIRMVLHEIDRILFSGKYRFVRINNKSMRGENII